MMSPQGGISVASWERIIQSVNKHRQSLPFIGLCWGLLGPGSSLGPTVTDCREAGQTQVTELLVPWRKSPWSLRNPDNHRVERNEFELPGFRQEERVFQGEGTASTGAQRRV